MKQDWRLQLSFDTTLKIGFQELRFTSDGERLSRELDESYYTCARGYRVEALPSGDFVIRIRRIKSNEVRVQGNVDLSWIECVGLILTRARAMAVQSGRSPDKFAAPSWIFRKEVFNDFMSGSIQTPRRASKAQADELQPAPPRHEARGDFSMR